MHQYQNAPLQASGGHVNCWNVANAGLYAMVCIVMTLAYFERLPWGNGSPHDVLFTRYPTLITHGEEGLAIVPVMILFDGVFVFFQLLPAFRNNALVTIITPWWVATSFLMVQWVRELCENTPGSLAYSMCIVLLMLSFYLGMILVIDARKPNFFEFWCLRAPFSINAGWLIYVSAVNVNMWAASLDPPLAGSSKMAIAMVSLSWIFVLTALFGINTRRPDPLLIAPVAWCLFWVWRSNAGEQTGLAPEIVNALNIAATHAYTGVCSLGVMAFFIRMSMACVSNKIPEAYAHGGLVEAGVSVVI